MCKEVHPCILHSKHYFKDYVHTLIGGFVRFEFFSKGCFRYICCNLPNQEKYENEWENRKPTKPHYHDEGYEPQLILQKNS